jgi:ATP-dependent helicase HrpB
VSSDTALALCVEVQRTLRPELRLVVMSATLFDDAIGADDDATNGAGDDTNGDKKTKDKLLDTLGGDGQCQILMSSGRMYPITMQWARKGYPPLGVLLKSRNDLVATMCDAIEEGLRLSSAQGDVLAFYLEPEKLNASYTS